MAALQFCINLLSQREESDPNCSWLWTSKKKVAIFCLRSLHLATDTQDTRDDYELASEEKELILRAHPLLQMDRIPPAKESGHEHAEWVEEIRRKVLAFAEAFAAHGRLASRLTHS
ncbi:MAG: hypothetical protein NTX50_15605 [Candidatus Sumerlaeota bacterium]|nr:hypothetical protein [Candidatus Sumerlaeota bacterium]